MRIAIVSDTHSRYAAVEAALKRLDAERVDLILHCGDIDDAETVWLFPSGTHFVFGNCDLERTAIRQAVYGIGGTLHEPFGQLEVAQTRIAFVHGDDHRLLERLATGGDFDFVFHGHTHQAGERQIGTTRLVNPGALHRARPKTFAILDLQAGQLESIVVE
jgi:hypothetical protein